MTKKSSSILKSNTKAVIKKNGNREITPELDSTLRIDVIDSMVNSLDGGSVMEALFGQAVYIAPVQQTDFTPKKYVDDSISNVSLEWGNITGDISDQADLISLLGVYLKQGENDLTEDLYFSQAFKTQIDEYLRVGSLGSDRSDTKLHIVSDNTRNYGIYHFAAGGAGEVFYTRNDGVVNSRLGYWIDGQRVLVYEDSSSNFGFGLNSLQGISATSVFAIGNYAAYFNSLIENNSVVFSSSYKNYDLQGAYIGQGNIMPVSIRNASVNSGVDQDASNGILRLSPSRGTGNAPGGSVAIQKAITQASGSTLHTLEDWWIFANDGSFTAKGDFIVPDDDIPGSFVKVAFGSLSGTMITPVI